MIILGLNFFGRSQKTASGHYICTKFAHVSYVPLIPVRSFIVLKKSSRGIVGKPISLNLVSVLTAYARGIAGLSIFLYIVMLFVYFSEVNAAGGLDLVGRPWMIIATVWVLACVVGLIVSYIHPKVVRASEDTERWIGEQLKELQSGED